MALSQDLVNQFVKVTNDTKKEKTEVNVKGTYKKINGVEYVQIDGSDILTPVTSTVSAETGEHVNVLIKDHTATVTGNISSPAARTKSVNELADKVDENGNVIKMLDTNIKQQNVSISQINTNITQINTDITQANAKINQQDVQIQQFDTIIKQQGDNITSMNNKIVSQGNEINLLNNTIDAQGNIITAHGNTIIAMNNTVNAQGNDIRMHGNSIEGFNSDIRILNSAFTIEDGVLKGLSTIIVDTLNAKYANIDFANIKMAAVEKLFTESGIINDLIVSEGKITGKLVGVTIKGDLIEGNTVKADKLVVKGSDGLYYKLNVTGETVEAEQTDENSLNGSIITAKSITASKIAVDDLVAFNATIGGFHISNTSLYSGVKASVDNTTPGIYSDKNGQIAIGDINNYVKYYLDPTTNVWKLDISADSIKFKTSELTIEEQITNAQNTANAKNRIFYSQPTPPYSIDDLWITKTDEENGKYNLLKCQVNKTATEAFNEADWNVFSNFTDDTTANEAIRRIGIADGNIQGITEWRDKFIDEDYNNFKDTTGKNIKAANQNASDAMEKAKLTAQDLENEVKNIHGYMRYTSSTGTLELGAKDNKFKTRITNNELGFYEDENKVSYINGNKMYITVAQILTQLGIGNFGFTVNSDNSLTFGKIK